VPVTPRSSNDPILTAFAQLGALRLNVKRGLITLSTNCKEYIIAESGQSLSLQKDDDEQDRLWHGIGQISCTTGAGPELASIFCTAGESLTHLAINDLTKDEQFCEKDIVVGPPYARFLACVPLRTPHYGVVIGTYIVVDDKPRDGLNERELQFLIDMGVTVMDYLEAGLVKRKQHRAARMVKAMGLFIEGKATLRDWWLELGHKSQNIAVKKRVKNIASLERQADVEFGVQDPTDDFARKGLNGLPDHHERPSWSRSPSSSAFSIAERNDGRPGLPRGASHISSSDRDTTVQSTPISQAWNDRNSSITTFGTPTEPTTDSGDREKHNSVSFDLPPDTSASSHVSKELQDAVLSGDLKGVFARASNLIREAIGVEGVVYFDASVGSFGGSATRNVMDEKAPGAFNPGNLVTSSEDDFSRKMSVSVSDVDGFLHAMSSAQETDSTPPEKCCNILGFSTRHRSSLRGHPTSEELRCLPETIIRRLLKRYPHGKVFNFDEDGQMSSESEYTSGIETPAESESPQPTPIELKARRKRQSRESEAKAILKVVPGARSVFWFPLWDQNRDRWFAGSLVWSTSPTRVLCPVEDITYLAAFANSTMAEVSRLSAQLLAQMKTDFISSISHELRSPLHGVLASVEFLQETDMTEVQTDMVNNIHASGKVLLDTINHVLDFSKVNRRSKDKGRISKRAAKRLKRSRQPTGEDGAATDDNADVCILSEEVIESIYAGHRVSKHAFGSSTERHPSIAEIKDSPVTIIVEIPWRPNWTFDIDAGAWRRILMNLFSNAMKYTKSGFIKISLDVEEDVASRGKRQRSNLILKVKDSGKGISQEFLKHQLFRPFKQEDSLATGAGLGLSIIRHIIQDLGGNIDFSSEQGTGTEATVRIPLIAPNPSANADWETITEVRRHTTGLKFSLEGFERMPDISETPDGILSSDFEAAMLLKSTSNRILLGWFDMTPASPAPTGTESPDVIVIMEAGLKGKTLQDTLEPYSRNRAPGSKKATAVILCNTCHPGSKTESDEHFNIYHLQQPLVS
jgi:signal transduction histidine kinase